MTSWHPLPPTIRVVPFPRFPINVAARSPRVEHETTKVRERCSLPPSEVANLRPSSASWKRTGRPITTLSPQSAWQTQSTTVSRVLIDRLVFRRSLGDLRKSPRDALWLTANYGHAAPEWIVTSIMPLHMHFPPCSKRSRIKNPEFHWETIFHLSCEGFYVRAVKGYPHLLCTGFHEILTL